MCRSCPMPVQWARPPHIERESDCRHPQGKVTPVIDRTYPLSEAPEAIRYLEGGHARGKVVIMV
jgi:NADPH:quinone reductase-like Zn-dependent oxidoreductase